MSNQIPSLIPLLIELDRLLTSLLGLKVISSHPNLESELPKDRNVCVIEYSTDLLEGNIISANYRYPVLVFTLYAKNIPSAIDGIEQIFNELLKVQWSKLPMSQKVRVANMKPISCVKGKYANNLGVYYSQYTIGFHLINDEALES